MDAHDSDRRGRAERRARSMVLHKGLRGAPERELSPLSGVEALNLVTQLSRESWLEGGRELPTYTRPETPFRFVRERA